MAHPVWRRPARHFEAAERVARVAGLSRLRQLTPAAGIRELAAMAALADGLAPLSDAGVRRAREHAHAQKVSSLERAARALRLLGR